jgi:pilus assembly protein TadC
MSIGIAMVLAAAAVVLAAPPTSSRRRLRLIHGPRPTRVSRRPAPAAVPLLALAAAVVLGVTVGTGAGAAAGVLVAFAGRRGRPSRDRVDVPLLADLVAACLASGATMPDALRAVAHACPDAAGLCRTVADRLASGAPPAEAWVDWIARPDLAPMARVCVRAADSGAATTEELRRAGDRVRTYRRAELAARAQRAGVWAVLPLGLCFLPAFALVGIVPFAWGLLGR